MIGRAVGLDRYDIAKAVSDQTNTLAQKFGDAAAKKDARRNTAEVERLEKAYADIPAAKITLEVNATDPAANLTVGKYQLDKGDSDGALTYLSLSGDPQYKDLAAKDLASPEEPQSQFALADGWWTWRNRRKNRG